LKSVHYYLPVCDPVYSGSSLTFQRNATASEISVKLPEYTASYNGNALQLYSTGARFESRPGHQVTWEILRGFPQSLQENDGLAPRLGDDCFLPNFAFIYHLIIRRYINSIVRASLNNQPRQLYGVTLYRRQGQNLLFSAAFFLFV
jgi:hypothetical protein